MRLPLLEELEPDDDPPVAGVGVGVGGVITEVPAEGFPVDGVVPAPGDPAPIVPALGLPVEGDVPEFDCEAGTMTGLFAGVDIGVETGIEAGLGTGLDSAKVTIGTMMIVAIAINFVMFLFIICLFITLLSSYTAISNIPTLYYIQ